MGLSFILIGIPALIIGTFALTIYTSKIGHKKASLLLAVLWVSPILIFVIGYILNHSRKPIKLIKRDLVGEYRIDTTFYPGKNARWQYDHYRFFIAENDSLTFIVYKEKDTPLQSFKYKIFHGAGPPYGVWKINADTMHHVIRNGPTLYRAHATFYYVFHSRLYGNMFFRKQK